MEIIRYTAPYDSKATLDLIESIFGEFERNLETPQLDGTEARYNLDTVFMAVDGDNPLGMIHITIPKANPTLAGISAVLTTEEARGKGIGRLLFKTAMDEIDSLGVTTAFLGTGNPIAHKLYSSFGFSYLVGSDVMIRHKSGGVVDFYRDYFEAYEGKLTVSEMTAEFRIPIIPLALHRSSQIILDANVDLVSTSIFNQTCCMSLYPRYMNLIEKGGKCFTVKDGRGVIGAAASIAEDKNGSVRADVFLNKSYEAALPDLISSLKSFKDTFYFEIARRDGYKENLLAPYLTDVKEESYYEHKGVLVPTVKRYIK